MAPPRRPDPAPLEGDDVLAVGVGTALWTVALAVLVVLDLTGTSVHGWWTAMCALGAGLGLLGLRWCVRRRARLAALPAPGSAP